MEWSPLLPTCRVLLGGGRVKSNRWNDGAHDKRDDNRADQAKNGFQVHGSFLLDS